MRTAECRQHCVLCLHVPKNCPSTMHAWAMPLTSFFCPCTAATPTCRHCCGARCLQHDGQRPRAHASSTSKLLGGTGDDCAWRPHTAGKRQADLRPGCLERLNSNTRHHRVYRRTGAQQATLSLVVVCGIGKIQLGAVCSPRRNGIHMKNRDHIIAYTEGTKEHSELGDQGRPLPAC